MTINHIYIRVTACRFAAVRSFYVQALRPLGYRELITIDPEGYVGIGSNYPYLFLRALPRDQPNVPTHIAFDAHRNADVDAFHKAGLSCGGQDNGSPKVHAEMSVQPYYSGFLLDPDGNNVEAVCVPIAGSRYNLK
ncbi:uncharacterized protein AB675_3122 [Cyphellophora attinorum]|uniref:VOC domain-containing protein n=1 Tax=Cyphellophora attinorum TaxID=1664694 RepID=A0A0N1HLI3_9EURO|nr:uncharacterized protein AB675_3122 [Phialophora attinorum]KPI37885.1 hypothetical protein AB675_3122 [Phialophora attinorum]